MLFDIQKASRLKRFSAWLLDAILLLVLAVGAMAALGWLLDANSYSQEMNGVYDRYRQEYNLNISQEEYDKMTQEQREAYQAAYEAADKAFLEDTEAQALIQKILSLFLTMISGGMLVAFLLLEFLVPLLLKNGQTIGKKAFGIAVMRKDGVKVTAFAMFARSILGKYTTETMIPLLSLIMLTFGAGGFMGILLLFGVLTLVMVLPLGTRNRTALHDIMACTIAVDLNSQMIFDTPEDLLEYQKKFYAEEAKKANY